MLVTKINPVGIDWYIQQLQTRLHTELVGVSGWNLSDTGQYKCYGRAYRNKKGNGYVAENYESDKEYKEVYWDDTLTAISFFGLSSTPVKKSIKSEAEVHLVFFADLDKLALKDSDGNTIAHRADEELRNSVLNVIGKFSYGFSVLSVELWLENVLREYSGSYRDERLKTVDMHPVHCFRINMKIIFDQNKHC